MWVLSWVSLSTSSICVVEQLGLFAIARILFIADSLLQSVRNYTMENLRGVEQVVVKVRPRFHVFFLGDFDNESRVLAKCFVTLSLGSQQLGKFVATAGTGGSSGR